MATTEYDGASSSSKGVPEAKHYQHESTKPSDPNDGHLRVAGANTGDVNLEVLKQSITFPFSGRTAKNRFLKAPMTERLCQWNADDEPITKRGYPTEEYTRLYQRWGEGEIGIIVAGNVMIKYDAVEAYGNPILVDNNDARLTAFRTVTTAAKAHNSLFIAQLSHPGRQGGAALNPHPVSASDIHLNISWAGNTFAPPRALTIPEIHALVSSFATTAQLCHEAGFDGVQIHCAHGYLLAQFLSQTTNKRTDAYGGDLFNRSRIIFDIIAAVKERVRDEKFMVCVKINSVEFQPGGQTPEDCRDLCVRFEEAGVDFVDLSGGTFEGRAFEHKKESTKARESYFIEFAEMIRPLLKKTKVYVTGGFRTAAGMTRAIEEGSCDGIGIGRPLGAEPYLCKELLAGKVTGALENFVPLPQNTQATGTQLHQVGKGHEAISDYSDETEVARWVKAFEKETKRREEMLPRIDSSGYPLITAERGFLYSRA